MIKLKNYLTRIVCTFILPFILMGCYSGRYTLFKKGKQKDVFIVPPSNLFKPKVRFNRLGDIAGKGKVYLGFEKIMIKNPHSDKISYRDFKVRRNNRFSKQVTEGLSPTEVNPQVVTIFAHFDSEDLMSVDIAWDYNRIYSDGAFNALKFIDCINDLRLILNKLEFKSWTIGEHELVEGNVVLKVKSRVEGVSMEAGYNEKIVNVVFENLPLPKDLSLFNNGFLPSDFRKKYAQINTYVQFLQAGFGINTFYSPSQLDSVCRNTEYFGYGLSAHLHVHKDEMLNKYIYVYGSDTRRGEQSCDSLSYASLPIDFNQIKLKGKYLVIYSGMNINLLRPPYKKAGNQLFYEDIMLIAVDDLTEIGALMRNEDFSEIKREIGALKKNEKLFFVQNGQSNDGTNLYNRLFYGASIPIFIKNEHSEFQAFVPLGSNSNNINDDVHKIRRFRICDERYYQIRKKVRGLSRLESYSIYNQLLVHPKDIIK